MSPAEQIVTARMSGEERRLSILQASIPVFAKKGFEGTTTKEIAEASNVSEALLYRHFKSKDELYTAIQDMICDSKDMIVERFGTFKPSAQTLVLVVYFMMRMIIDRSGDPVSRSIPRLFLMSLLEDGDFVKTFYAGRMTPLYPLVEASLEAAFESGELNIQPIKSKSSLWFIHHVYMCMRIYSLPGSLLDYGLEGEDETLHIMPYILRGLGLKESAIEKYLNWDELENQFNYLCANH